MKATIAICLLAIGVRAEEKKPFGAGMNGDPPAVPYQGSVEYWNQVLEIYPEAANQKSPLFAEMGKINRWLESTKDPVCSVPDRKLRVAHMAAAKLGMLRQTGPAAAQIPAGTQQRVNPAELMQMIQTEDLAGGDRKWSGSANPKYIYPKGKYAGKTKEQLIAACIAAFAKQYGYTPIYEDGAPIGGWKTEEGRRAYQDKQARRAEELRRMAAEAETQRKLDEVNRKLDRQ